jgi:tetratricopeptide (TPR) repeat protein
MSRLYFFAAAALAAVPCGCVLTQPDEPTSAPNYQPAALQGSTQPRGVPADLGRNNGGGIVSNGLPSGGAAPARELPPEQAAQVCLATAEVLEKKGHDREALLEYQRAREKNPRLPGLSRRVAALYARTGNMEAARLEYLAALQEQPRDADLLNDVGYCYYLSRDGKNAENYLRSALAANPNHQRAWVNLGKVLVLLNRTDESCAAFGRVVSPAEASANVGILLAKEGKIIEARQALNRALMQQPDLQSARAMLAQLDAATGGSVH